MKVFEPRMPFADIPNVTGPDSALMVVRSLTEEQVRYALWATLVALFGSSDSRAPEKVAWDLPSLGKGEPEMRAFSEAHYILAQIGIGRKNPNTVENIRRKQGL